MGETANHLSGMSKHRIDALTDGIFAVAMTLLVIELKIPEGMHVTDSASLNDALMHLIPRFVSWLISFAVLAFFWLGHHRAFHYVHRVDGKLLGLNLLFLGVVSLMPFASAISGEHVVTFTGQVIYSLNMFMSAISALLIWRYVHRHPELCSVTMTDNAYRAARIRTMTLMLISLVAVVISFYLPGGGNMAFMLMMVAGRIGRRIEAGDNNLSPTPSK